MGCSSWAVPDGAPQTKPDNGSADPNSSRRVTILDPSDFLGDPGVQQTMRELVEAAGRLVANRSVPGSGVTVPCGTVDDTGRVELSSEAMKKTNTSKAPERKIREMPMRKFRACLI